MCEPSFTSINNVTTLVHATPPHPTPPVRLAGDDVDAPTVVQAAADISAVSSLVAGRAHTAALTHDGAAYTWGCGMGGKLGWASSQQHGNIRKVALPPSAFAAGAALGDAHTLLVDRGSGGVLAFGENKEAWGPLHTSPPHFLSSST